MNERIKQLIEQCETAYSDRNEDGRIYTEFDKEKFAELIIKECRSIAFHKMALDVAAEIDQHFGIEG